MKFIEIRGRKGSPAPWDLTKKFALGLPEGGW